MATQLSAKTIKIIKTINLKICVLLMGMCMAITGPTILDLQALVKADTEHIAFIFTSRSTGYLIGSLIGGVLFDWTMKKQIIFTVLSLLNTITMFSIPWCRTLGILIAFMAANGLSLGFLDTGASFSCLHLWGSKSGPFFQALHFSFGLGGLLSPLIAAPFLETHPEEMLSNETNFINRTLQEILDLEDDPFIAEKIPSVTYAYTIIGCIGIIITASFLFVCTISPIDVSQQKEKNYQTRPISRRFIILVVLLNFCLLLFETGIEIGYAQMVTSYAVKGPLKLSKAVGSYMTSTFWAAFTLFRLSSVFLAIKLSSRTLVVINNIIAALGALTLLCFASTHEWALWLASALLGAGIATLFPSTIAWVDQYINVNNKIVSLFIVAIALGEMINPYLISHFIEDNPEVVIYVVCTSCVLLIMCTVTMFLVLSRYPEKHLKENTEENESL